MTTPNEAYQTGLLDAVHNRVSLAPVLKLAGETEMLLSYVDGLLTGEMLLADEINAA